MTQKKFFQLIAASKVDVVSLLLALLRKTKTQYCLIGGLAVNAYAEPVVSLDLDIIVVADKADALVIAARGLGLKAQRFEHSVNLSLPGAQLRIQMQIDERYQAFLSRSVKRQVLGYTMRVARIEDVLQGKVWAYSDNTRRASKRQKDLADIMRLTERYSRLKKLLPSEIASLIA